MPRCCPVHHDWLGLGEHLVDSDASEVAELIARQQVMFHTGEVNEVARLDPESHAARRKVVVEVAAEVRVGG